jgi:protein-S-isoprenylcysteine O-methyltransferase Ste14
MAKTVALGILGGAGFLALFGALLFGCAERWDLPVYWAYLGVWAAAIVFATPLLDPTLIQERIRPGPGGQDYATVILLTPLSLGQCVIAALDVGRYHWSDTVPVVAQVIALLVIAVGVAVFGWAEVVDRFFSSVIRIQTERGHRVITTGPYRYLRHPGYAACPLIFLGAGFVLGSWMAVVPGILVVVLILRRTAEEDRILHEQLEGYADYARRVRYRVFPEVW